MRRLLAVVVTTMALAASCSSDPGGSAAGPTGTDPPAPPASTESVDPEKAAEVMDVVRQAMAEDHLRSTIVRVTIDGEEIVTDALGTSVTGVPATTDMHFRNGAVTISYVAHLLLQLVDEGTVSLDDKVSEWLPDIPNADRVTLGQLASMTSGYHDYVEDPAFVESYSLDPFQTWTPEQLVETGTAEPLYYEPGTNWNYSHTNYVILGLALEAATGREMTELMQDMVLDPLGLDATTDPQSPQIQQPALHAFSSDRRGALGIPDGTGFYEESTYWNPSWTITHGAIQTTDIYDMNTTAIAIGTGEGLSEESHEAMISTRQRDFGGPVDGCATCRAGTEEYTYGIGVVIVGDWLMQNPTFGGYAAVEAYLPSGRIAISVALTYEEDAFDADGEVPNQADALFRDIARVLAPDDAPPS